MRIAIVGCGAMGSIYAGLLASAGHDVLAVGRNTGHMQAIGRDGLRITGASGDRLVRLHAFTETPDEVVDLLVIAVKAGHVGEAAEAARRMVGPDTLVLTIQNGLGSAEVVAGRLGGARLMVGVAQGFGASIVGPGHVHHNDMKAIRMGACGALDGAAVERTAGIWRDAGFDAAAVDDILAMQWDKLICNVAYSAPCALTGLTVGEAMDDEFLGAVTRAAAVEAFQVANALGIDLGFEDPVAHVRAFASRMPAARPSVLQDLEAGRRSEVDVINGSIPREAAKVGMRAPVNETLTALVRAREQGTGAKQGSGTVTETVKEKLLEADARRRAAMVAADVDTLTELLDDELVWTHSSGKTDTKASFLEGIASGVVTYLALDVEDVSVLKRGDVLVCHGQLAGRASRDGVEKTLKNRFLSVWVDHGGRFSMIAWQSTGV